MPEDEIEGSGGAARLRRRRAFILGELYISHERSHRQDTRIVCMIDDPLITDKSASSVTFNQNR